MENVLDRALASDLLVPVLAAAWLGIGGVVASILGRAIRLADSREGRSAW
jgi:hypothetical protein